MSIVSLFEKNATNIGGLTFDAQFEEQAEQEYEISDYAVENKEIMSDHIRKLPGTIRLVVGASDDPFAGVLEQLGGAAAGFALSKLPPAVSQIGAAAGSLANAAFGAEGPDTRSAKVWQQMVEIADKCETFELVTQRQLYKNVAIKKISYTLDVEFETCIVMNVELRQVQTYEAIDLDNLIDSDVSNPTAGSPEDQMMTPEFDMGSSPMEMIA